MKYLLTLVLAFSLAAFAGELKELKTGDNAPQFDLKNYDGKAVSLSAMLKQNKYAVIMFISTQCPVSNAYNGRMEKLFESYGKKGIAFAGINANKEELVADIAAHAKDKGFTFPVLKDEKNVIADAYGAQSTPEVYVVNQKGKLLYHGRIDDSKKEEKVQSSDLANALDALLAGKNVTVAQTKAIGCSIKRIGE